jgi:hypothetical protein
MQVKQSFAALSTVQCASFAATQRQEWTQL